MGFAASIEPLIPRVRGEARPTGVRLAVRDGSAPAVAARASKTDRRQLARATAVGYDLAAVPIVRGSDGASLAPVPVGSATRTTVPSTRPDPVADVARVDRLRPRMDFVASLNLGAPVVRVIDRGADSVGHWRDRSAAGRRVLVRADDRLVWHNGREQKLARAADALGSHGGLKGAGGALYRGRRARRFVGRADVVRHRPAERWDGRRQHAIAGEPSSLRSVVVESRDATGRVLSVRLLPTNVPTDEADAARAARRYYWRRRIESRHELLESAGRQLESGLQRNGTRPLRKLLAALAARAEVRALERRGGASSEALKGLLVSLSGRQTKHRQPVTTPALLAGLWVLQQAASWLSRDGPNDPNVLLEQHLPLFATDAPQNE